MNVYFKNMNGKSLNNPVLRWAGGKTWMVKQLLSIMPQDYQNYHEPFVGGGSVFLNICNNSKGYISDTNKELICFYSQVKYNVEELVDLISTFTNTEPEYYIIRNWLPKTELEIAARFYYLNRTCFNGLYRVNQEGKFNVPYGFRHVSIVDRERFANFNQRLKKVHISCRDFYKAIKNVGKNDFVFLDPPYTVAHNKNGFIEYNQNIFSWDDQERLCEGVCLLMKQGAYFLMTNGCHSSIRNLYKNIGKHLEIDRYSTISSNMNARKRISELIITNCL